MRPGLAEMAEDEGLDLDGRAPLDRLGSAPGEDGRLAVDPRMTEPGLGRGDESIGYVGTLATGSANAITDVRGVRGQSKPQIWVDHSLDEICTP